MFRGHFGQKTPETSILKNWISFGILQVEGNISTKGNRQKLLKPKRIEREHVIN